MVKKNSSPKKGEIKIKLNSNGIKNVVEKFAGKLNQMLNQDINESIEIGSKKVGNAKVDYGIRMKFLDVEKNKKSEIKFIKKSKKK